jgi:hypothetical protein
MNTRNMKLPFQSSRTAVGASANRPITDSLATGPKLERSRVIDRLEAIITQDIGGRGLAVDPDDNLVTRCRGNLERAARDIAENGATVAILSGFYVAHANTPAIETDGPCGAIALAWLLSRLGCRVTLVTDSLGEASLRAGLHAAPNSSSISLEVFPFDERAADTATADRSSNDPAKSVPSAGYVESFFRSGAGESLTHLIAIERAGPNWSKMTDWTEFEQSRFADLCPPQHQNEVHNFRGRIITEQTAKTHLLFDFVQANDLPVRTIGIGDGGNEIGMGSIPWQVIHANIPSGLGARIACRVATDWTIACGVSNWGAYALATSVAHLRDESHLLHEWTDDQERSVLAALVNAGAVDGVTGKRSLSVDGLEIDHHLAIWRQIRQALQ